MPFPSAPEWLAEWRLFLDFLVAPHDVELSWRISVHEEVLSLPWELWEWSGMCWTGYQESVLCPPCPSRTHLDRKGQLPEELPFPFPFGILTFAPNFWEPSVHLCYLPPPPRSIYFSWQTFSSTTLERAPIKQNQCCFMGHEGISLSLHWFLEGTPWTHVHLQPLHHHKTQPRDLPPTHFQYK